MGSEFVTAINCIDGRVQEPIINMMKNDYKAEYVDMITEAGPNLILAEKKDINIIEHIRRRVAISVEKHNSNLIAIIGHYDCAGNPKPKAEQIIDIKKSIETIIEWNLRVDKIIGVWVNKYWEAEII